MAVAEPSHCQSQTQLAIRVLRRARELAEKFHFDPNEIELSILAAQPIPPELLDLLVIAVHDAGRIVQVLWPGNHPSGQTLSEVERALAGQSCDVPADEVQLALVIADDGNFEKKLAAILRNTQLFQEDDRLAAVISALRNPAPPDKTIKEVHERTVQMAEMLRGAIALIKQRGSLQAVLQIQPRTRAAAVVEFFVRDHPAAEAAAATSLFDRLAGQFEHDGAALVPYLERHGTRSVASVGKVEANRPSLPSDRAGIGSYVQAIREARYAGRQLPGLMERLRETLAAPVMDEISHLPLEKVAERIEAERSPDERARAADEMRQLRDVFASTGFGDLFSASDNFLNQGAFAEPTPKLSVSSYHGPDLLDLLLDQSVLSISTNQSNLNEWPSSVVRVKTDSELVDMVSERSSMATAIILSR